MFDEYGNPIGPVRTGYPFNSPFAPTAQAAGSSMFPGYNFPTPQVSPVPRGYGDPAFQMPPLGQDTGLGGVTDYTGGFNTTGQTAGPVTGVSAGNQNELFEMPSLGQPVGLGGVTDYSGGFNTGGPVDAVPGLAGQQRIGLSPEADIPLPFETPIGITGMGVIQPKPIDQQNTLTPLRSLGIPEVEVGPYATPGSVADTSMQAMKTLGVQPIEGVGGPNMGGLMTGGAPVGPAATAAASASSVADSAKSGMNVQQAGMAASGVLGVVGGVTDIVMGAKQMRDAQAQQKKQQNEIDKLKASQPSLSTPAEYYERVKNAYDTRLMQMRTEDINRNLANTTAAATSFGSRGLGALAGATSAANRAQRAEVLEQQQRQTAALGDLAGAQERSTQMREARNVRETNFAQDQLMAAQALEQQSRQQMMSGIAGTVGGAAQAALGFGAFGPLTSVAGAALEEGGKVQKTPGKFSHEENEMAVITEEGDDTGIRVTGGEYVLNPDQAKSIKRLVESKDKEGLMKFMDDLLDEPQFA